MAKCQQRTNPDPNKCKWYWLVLCWYVPPPLSISWVSPWQTDCDSGWCTDVVLPL